MALGSDSTLRQPEAQPGAQRSPGLVISRITAHNPGPEITLEIGLCDIRIRRSSHLAAKDRTGGGVRSNVTTFSNAAKRRLFFTARNFPDLDIMLTLTYPADFPMDGRLVKSHWRRFRQWMVRNGGKTGLWVLEFQKRGAPHFHIFLQQPLDRIAVSKERQKWTSHKRFGDNGRSGFIAWETSTIVQRMLDEFFEDSVLYPT